MGASKVEHCFPLTGNKEKPEVQGVSGIMQAYDKTLMDILFSGPTLFAPGLEAFKKQISQQKGQKVYNILLILTDGQIDDMPKTKELIVELSHLPCSIIIVGIGEEDFSKMDVLDGDHHILTDD